METPTPGETTPEKILFSELRRYRFEHPSVTANAKAMLEYIEQLAIQTSTNIDSWALEPFVNVPLNPLNKREVNRIFFAKKEEHVQGLHKIDVQAEEQMTEMSTRLQEYRSARLAELEYNRKLNVTDALGKYSEFTLRLSRAWGAQKEIYALQEKPANYIREEVTKLLKDGFWEFDKYANGILTLLTANDVVMSEVNKTAGINRRINLGRFQLQVVVPTMDLKVLRHKRNIHTSGHWHPYIGDTGDICWGNAGNTAANLLAQGKLYGALTLLASLLITYSPDSHPWARLSAFEQTRRYDADEPVCDEEDLCEHCEEHRDDCECYGCDFCDHRGTDSCETHHCGICDGNAEECGCCPDCSRVSEDCTRCRECDEHDGDHARSCSKPEDDDEELEVPEETPLPAQPETTNENTSEEIPF